MRTRTFLFVGLLPALLAACNSGSDDTVGASPVVVRACDALKVGDWNAVMEAIKDDSFPNIPAEGPTPSLPVGGGAFSDRLSNSAIFAQKAPLMPLIDDPVAWAEDWEPSGALGIQTLADARNEGKVTFNGAWQTCAELVQGYPAAVDSDLEDDVMVGSALANGH